MTRFLGADGDINKLDNGGIIRPSEVPAPDTGQFAIDTVSTTR